MQKLNNHTRLGSDVPQLRMAIISLQGKAVLLKNIQSEKRAL